jgi:hypothetical protein
MVSALARVQSVQPALLAQPVQHLQVEPVNTPALVHPVGRRQQVAGEPQPSSRAGVAATGVEVRAM